MDIGRIKSGIKSFFRRESEIMLFYYNPPGVNNFGDILNISILHSLGVSKVTSASTDDSSHVCIGSLLEQFLCLKGEEKMKQGRQLTIWGSGFIAGKGMHPIFGQNSIERFRRKIKVCAVRGKLTKKRLSDMDLNVAHCALGDPGILINKIYTRSARLNNNNVGIIPHYVDKADPAIKIMLERIKGSVEIDITDTPKKVIEEISQCKFILSTAMHGLIAADALRIPNIHFVLGDKLTGGEYKFRDYYSAYDLEYRFLNRDEALNLSTKSIAMLSRGYQVTDLHVKQVCNDLLKTNPFK